MSVGALLPDLIDKPLAWRFTVLPHGRTFAHSLVIGGVVLVVVGYVARRYGQQGAFRAFAIGYLAHLAGDAYQPFLAGNLADLFFLAWPLMAAPTTGETVGVVAQLRQVEPTPFFLFGVAVTLLGGVAWWFHGRPGIGTVRGVLPSPRHR